MSSICDSQSESVDFIDRESDEEEEDFDGIQLMFAPLLTPGNMSKQTRKTSMVIRSHIPIKQLKLSPSQKTTLTSAHKSKTHGLVDFRYNDSNQLEARELLQAHFCDHISLDHPGTKWSKRWCSKPKSVLKKVLFQCTAQVRRQAWPFTGCLAHVEITTDKATKLVRRIQGILTHHAKCMNAQLTRLPKWSLHKSVLDHALQQMLNGATLTGVQEANRRLVESGGYSGQTEDTLSCRFLIGPKDGSSLYARYLKHFGVDVKTHQHINVDNWLTPSSPSYNSELAKAVFYYVPRTIDHDRLIVCMATEDMRKAAWQYAHGKQLLLDGTFGVCNRRILLFILMGLDEQHHGVPLAFILFSAPPNNRQVAAGYDSNILTEVLQAWKKTLSATSHRQFEPLVTITDTDAKERLALLQVWPNQKLLLCRYHVRQCWTNRRSKALRGAGENRAALEVRLKELESKLIHSTDFTTAQRAIQDERRYLGSLDPNSPAGKAAAACIGYLDYLSMYWMTEKLWPSWSDYGRQVAADLTGLTIDAVLTTNNHLESFNGLLKRKFLPSLTRNGHRMRLDTLIMLLKIKVADVIFQQRRLRSNEKAKLTEALASVPGASNVVAKLLGQAEQVRVAYLEPDTRRDEEARYLMENKYVRLVGQNDIGVALTCYSFRGYDDDGTWTQYDISLNYDSTASCTCPDFQNRGGACKHMRAGLLLVEWARHWALANNQPHEHVIQPINLPSNQASALRLHQTETTHVPLDCPAHQVAVPNPVQNAASFIGDMLQATEDDKEHQDPWGEYDWEEAPEYDFGETLIPAEQNVSLSTETGIDTNTKLTRTILKDRVFPSWCWHDWRTNSTGTLPRLSSVRIRS
ncbi:hypothetical protein FRC12_008470 [Ceratobasidium sp. 428]|nr:hypothetical protein FRC12_008470 [Ceratobasidium sp. 428]